MRVMAGSAQAPYQHIKVFTVKHIFNLTVTICLLYTYLNCFSLCNTKQWIRLSPHRKCPSNTCLIRNFIRLIHYQVEMCFENAKKLHFHNLFYLEYIQFFNDTLSRLNNNQEQAKYRFCVRTATNFHKNKHCNGRIWDNLWVCLVSRWLNADRTLTSFTNIMNCSLICCNLYLINSQLRNYFLIVIL